MNLSEKETSDLLKKIFTPILLVLGIFGNLLSILIFSKATMKKHTTFKYLLLLSIVDICCLLSGCGDIFLGVYFEVTLRDFNEFSCKLHSFMVIFFTHSSSMLLVCMSVDRVVVIKMKLGTKFSNPKMATKIFFIILALIAILNLHFLLFTHLITSEFIVNQNENATNTSIVSPHLISNVSFPNHTNFNHSVRQKVCYGYAKTLYFEYLSTIFPW